MVSQKHSGTLEGDTTMTQWSPWVPQRVIITSPWAGLVGWPVAGPTRCTSTRTTGISAVQARPNISCFREKPGPLVAVMAFLPPMEAPMAAPNPAISSSVCINLPPTWGRRAANCSAISVEGVMG